VQQEGSNSTKIEEEDDDEVIPDLSDSVAEKVSIVQGYISVSLVPVRTRDPLDCAAKDITAVPSLFPLVIFFPVLLLRVRFETKMLSYL